MTSEIPLYGYEIYIYVNITKYKFLVMPVSVISRLYVDMIIGLKNYSLENSLMIFSL